MKPEQASAFPPDDVSLPPTAIFEMRVIVFKTKDVPPLDSLEGYPSYVHKYFTP
jgi:hypothetical protein